MNENLASVPSSQRVKIGFFGCTNSGKSSLINALTRQQVSIVSSEKGTTTDPVYKAMELLPIGAVTLCDTAGIDDDSALGELRLQKTYSVLRTTDIAVIVKDGTQPCSNLLKELSNIIQKKQIPSITVYTKADIAVPQSMEDGAVAVSAVNGTGIDAFKAALIKLWKEKTVPEKPLIEDLVQEGSIVVFVTPIDESAPKGRLILPQVMTLRAALDSYAVCITVQPKQLEGLLSILKSPPSLVVTDSQVFGIIKNIVPESVPLTSFSILMARYKGVLPTAVKAMEKLRQLNDGDKVLISEGCTHHRQCGDIGTVKLPKWIQEYTGKKLIFDFTSGGAFPEDLSPYAFIVHCGGCMLSEKEMDYRKQKAVKAGVPFSNFGMVIAEVNGLMKRSTQII